MKATTNTLQQKIEERAYQIARSRMKVICDAISNDSAIQDVMRKFYVIDPDDPDKRIGLHEVFWNADYKIAKIIRKEILPNIIEQETKEFLDKVDNLAKDVEELKDMNY